MVRNTIAITIRIARAIASTAGTSTAGPNPAQSPFAFYLIIIHLLFT